jgi:AcrR family transcriptional regulator
VALANDAIAEPRPDAVHDPVSQASSGDGCVSQPEQGTSPKKALAADRMSGLAFGMGRTVQVYSGSSARDRILAASEKLVAEHGTSALTFENISQATGISRGGVLHHFRSKEALIEAMIQRFVAKMDDAFAAKIEADPEPVGRSTRAYVRASFEEANDASQGMQRLASALLATLYIAPEQMRPLTQQHARYQDLVEGDGLDPVMATIVRLAVEGLWLGEAFGNNRLSDAMRSTVLERLVAMTGQSTAPPPAPHKTRRQ